MIDIDLLLAWGATYKKLEQDEIVFMEGNNCNFYYQLVSGRIRWVNIDDEGKEFIQELIEPGECFGELPLFDEGQYAATAIADEDALVLRLHKSSFLQLLKDNSEVHFTFTRLLAGVVRFKFAMIRSLAQHSPENKIATLLTHFKQHHKNFCADCNQLKLTRQQIADMTGLRVETVIRAMRNMHDRGELLINHGKVYC
jgi:CRP/FNR family cyclic AMP-dependent transcriptional regulator